jgi:hypothetical protein
VAREWAVFALRTATENNWESQTVVDSLQTTENNRISIQNDEECSLQA